MLLNTREWGEGGRVMVLVHGMMGDSVLRSRRNRPEDGQVAAVAPVPGAGEDNDEVALLGIEEPETSLQPAAAGALFDALSEASERVQVVVTTQSADLLDRATSTRRPSAS